MLHVNVGAEMGMAASDLVKAIAGETGLPANVIGQVEVRERYSFIDLVSEHAKAVVAKLNRVQVNGRKLRVKVA